MREDTTDSGWAMIADGEEAATVIAGLLEVDADRKYTRSELAEALGIPLKTLYLIEILEDLEAIGMLDRIDDPGDESEATFVIDESSQVYQAAEHFDTAVAERL